jgi:hypothetical protein
MIGKDGTIQNVQVVSGSPTEVVTQIEASSALRQ